MLLLRLVVIFAGTAAYLGLAVLGEGSFAAFFSNKALVALAIALFALAVVAGYAGGNVSPGVREDRSNRWVLAADRDCICGRAPLGQSLALRAARAA